MSNVEFTNEIVRFVEEIKAEFEQKGKDDPIAFFIEATKKIKDTDEETAKKIFKEIISGIRAYKAIPKDAELSDLLSGKIKEEELKMILEEIKMLENKIMKKEE